MIKFRTLSDKNLIENEKPFAERNDAKTMFSFLTTTANKFPDRPALSFQLKSGAKDPAETYSWGELLRKVTQAANFFRAEGVQDNDVVAYILPNCNEAVVSFLSGVCAGIVCPINPLLDPAQISSILREVNAKVVVTLAPFPKTDVAQRVDEALKYSPEVKTLVEVDLRRYTAPPLSWIISVIRPKLNRSHSAKVVDFSSAMGSYKDNVLDFDDISTNRIGAYFHTGGTTGIPKVARHGVLGMIYQGWSTVRVLSSWSEQDSLICPLPMFHVFAVYPMLMTCVASGAHIIFPTPQGYRGDGVFDNFWKLVERWKVSFMVMVPAAATTLMQKEVDADVSSLRYAICGSAPLSPDLFNRFEKETGLKILEGYGMTESTCLITVNPPDGKRKIGSVGLPFPYTDLKIYHFSEDGRILKECEAHEVGEICVSNPGVVDGDIYTQATKNVNSLSGRHLRTGDLGKVDEDGFVWITGRAKDIIIRGGHNIDPAIIEDCLAGYSDVAMVGVIGQPDMRLGEVPCAYVELVKGANASSKDLLLHAEANIKNKLDIPAHVEILDALPLTGVGKIFKPDLRKRAIKRTFNKALEESGLLASVEQVSDDENEGLIAWVKADEVVSDSDLNDSLGQFVFKWKRQA